MNITLKQCEAIICLAHHQHFQRAADELHISQPALSRCIKTVELIVGAQIFDRHTREVKITGIGKELAKFADELLTLSQKRLDRIAAMVSGASGDISMAVLPSIANSRFSTVIANFMRERSGIRVQIHDLPADKIEQLVAIGDVDFGVGPAANNRHNLIISTPLMRDKLVLLLPVNHHLTKRTQISINDLANEPIVTAVRGTNVRRQVESIFRNKQCQFKPILELNQMGSIAAMVRARIGISLLPATYTASLRFDRKIIQRPLQQFEARDICILRRAGRPLIPAATALINALVDHAKTL